MEKLGTIIVERHEDFRTGEARAVVTRADQRALITSELLAEAQSGHARINGAIEVDGDLILFGTANEGLGRVAYRLVAATPKGYVIERVAE